MRYYRRVRFDESDEILKKKFEKIFRDIRNYVYAFSMQFHKSFCDLINKDLKEAEWRAKGGEFAKAIRLMDKIYETIGEHSKSMNYSAQHFDNFLGEILNETDKMRKYK